MSNLERRQQRSLFPEIADLFAGFPSFANVRPVFDARLMRLEDEMTKDGRYEVRAEMPGVDPAKDVDVTVHDGGLTIKAERTEKSERRPLRVLVRVVRSHGHVAGRSRRGRHKGELRQGHPDGVGGGNRTQPTEKQVTVESSK